MEIVNIARCPVHGLHGCRDICFAYEHEGEPGCDGHVEQVPMVAADYFSRDELDWLEAAARRAARDSMVPSSVEPLDVLARKLAVLARGPSVAA